MTQKRETSTRKRRAARQRKSVRLTGAPLPPNAGIAEAYVRKLEGLTRAMINATDKAVSAIAGVHINAGVMFSAQERIQLGSVRLRFNELFEKKAREMAESMLSASLKHSGNSLGVSLAGMGDNAGAGKEAKRSLKELSKAVSLKADFSPELRAGLAEAVKENTALIRSIPEKYHARLEAAVLKSVTDGKGMADIVQEIKDIGGVTIGRARFIAVDQTRKANGFPTRVGVFLDGARPCQF